jgi:hypothetical protein
MATILSNSDNITELCHNLLYYSNYSQHIVERLTVYTLSLNWLTWFLRLRRNWDTLFLCCGSACRWNLGCVWLLLLLHATLERRRGDTWCRTVWVEHHSRCSFGCSLWFPLLQLLLRVPAVPIVSRIGVSSLQQLVVAACWSGGSVIFLWTFFV